jgi:hypothetical protein
MDYKKIIADYEGFVEKLIDIYNKTQNLYITVEDATAKIKSYNPIPKNAKSNYHILEDRNNFHLRRTNGFGASYCIINKSLLNPDNLNKAIQGFHKKFEKELAERNLKLKETRDKIDHCALLMEDYKEPIVNYLNEQDLPCTDLKVTPEAIIYLTIDGKDRPVYDIRKFAPVKLRQYKGPGYSMVPQIYKKTLRKFLRENHQLKEFIF